MTSEANKLRIAHFTIGFPPLKGGGLVQYVVDLMEKQRNDNAYEIVTAFYPGRFTFRRQFALRKCNYKGYEVYEMINPAPSTLTEGTRYPEIDIQNNNEKTIVDKLNELKIDVAHFHTFFGISADLVKQIKETGIHTIYSAHDYQPLCPKLHLLDFNGHVCEETGNGAKCSICNRFALTDKQLRIRNSYPGLILQSSPQVKTLVKDLLQKRRGRSKRLSGINGNSIEYLNRRKSYVHVLNNYMDHLVYSSTIVEKYFKACGVKGSFTVMPVSNSKVNVPPDHARHFSVDLSADKTVTFGYMGGNRVEKGYRVLLKVFGEILKSGITRWRLLLFSEGARRIEIGDHLKNNVVKMGYQKGNIYDMFDILIVPSIWPETFGIVVSEALLHGKMVIASDLVGSAHYFKKCGLFMYRHDDNDALRSILEGLVLNRTRHVIKCGDLFNKCSFENHYEDIKKLYGSRRTDRHGK